MYKLIAFDMDGTLLDSNKLLTPKTVKAIEAAALAGKIIILNTGRCPAELMEYLTILPQISYFNCISGALVYDVAAKKALNSDVLPDAVVRSLFAISKKEDVMLQLLNADALMMDHDKYDHLDRYGMAHYHDSYQKFGTRMDHIISDYEKAPFPVFKLNLYHTSHEARMRTLSRIKEASLPVQLALAEQTSVEVSPLGIHKGTGLKTLCDHLGLNLAETIAVGDADNDLPALCVCGLPIAMANANEKVKAVCSAIVSDNDHDGCAEAIYSYLLS